MFVILFADNPNWWNALVLFVGATLLFLAHRLLGDKLDDITQQGDKLEDLDKRVTRLEADRNEDNSEDDRGMVRRHKK